MKLKKLTALILGASLALPSVPVFASGSPYLVNIMFDDAVTNDMSEYITVSGSSTARVCEDGNKNKSYTVDCGYVDNDISVVLPSYAPSDKYCLQFDIRQEGAPFGDKIELTTSKGIVYEAFKIDEAGTLRTGDDEREICSASGSRFKTVSLFFDNILKTYSVMEGGRLVVSKKPMSLAVSDIVKINISTDSVGEKSTLFLDNIRIYSGEKFINKKVSCAYNSGVMEYTAPDESKIEPKIYYKNTFDSASSVSMAVNAKTNKIEFAKDADGNGFIRLTKESTDDAYFDINIGKTAKKLIIESDLRFKKSSPKIDYIVRDSASGASQVTAGLISVKDAQVTGGGSSGSFSKNSWHKVSLMLDFSKHTFDFFIDGEKTASGKSFPETVNILSVIRMYVESGSDFGYLDMDNLAVYAGSEPRDLSGAEVAAESMFSGDDSGESFLRGKRALQTYSNTIYYSNKKSLLDKECKNMGDESLIPQDAFENLFKKKVTLSGEAITIEGGAKMAVGSDKMTVGDKEFTLSAAPTVESGTLYLPAVGYGENALSDGEFINDEHGTLFCGSGLKAEDARYKDANLYLFFERKTADELKETLLKNTDNLNAHPRLMVTESDIERLKREVKEDSYKKKWFENVLSAADGICAQSVAEYKITNSRLLDVANQTVSRLENLGFAYLMTGDKKYADRGIAELKAVCSFDDWHPVHFLDTGTLASGVAIGYDWLYSAMTDEERKFIAENAQRLGAEEAKLAYYNASPYGNWWAKTETNWGIIVNGGIADLCIATAEYNTDECMDILYNALRALECTWYRFAPDGAWYEGTGYWDYLLTHLDVFLAGYESAMGESFATNYRGLDKYGYFQAYFMGPDGLSNNFHDADLLNVQSSGQFYLGKIYDDDELMLYRRDQMEKYGIGGSVRDILWYNTSLSDRQSEIKLKDDMYFRETEFVSMREKWGSSDSAWLSYHGGYSNAAHDHIDVGTFVYTIGGVRWAVETGKEPLSYTAENPAVAAGYNAYYYYRRKGEGHNIVVINPDENLEYIQYNEAKVSEPVTKENGSYGVIDLSAPYSSKTNGYIRGYKLSDGRRTLTVRDEIELLSDSELHWFMHTEGDIRIIDNNTAVIYQGGKTLKMQFITNAPETTLSAVKAEPMPKTPKFTNTPNDNITKIDYKLGADGHTTITVKMSLLGEIGSESAPDDTDISDWDKEEFSSGESYLYSSARLSEISVGGEGLSGFNPEKFNYRYTKGAGGEVPKIEAGGADVEYYKRSDGLDAAVIKKADENGRFIYYSIVFDEYSKDSLDVYNSLPLTAISASSEQIEAENNVFNVKENSTDGNPDTRWSANGSNEWCVYDLGSVRKIDAFAVAFWMGAQRTFTFDVLVSDDNNVYKKVLSASSKAGTENAVVYIPSASVSARYIKFVGHGSNTNEWNNVIEFMALKEK